MEWAPAVTAISTAIIALAILAVAFVAVGLIRDLSRLTSVLERFLDVLERDARPVLDQTRLLVTDASRVASKLSAEVEGLADTSKDLRERIVVAVDRVEDRLADADALLDVIQEEVEETVLDVGAALRTTRRGASVLGAMKRALTGKKRRRRR